MHERIKVHVVSYGRKCLYMRYKCPMTGKTVARSTGCTRKSDATKAGGKWEAELREGKYKPARRITWVEFRHRYEDEVIPGLADRTGDKISGIFNSVEKHINPERLAQVTAERLSTLQAKLREAGRSEATIKGILAHLQAALRWAFDNGLMNEVPKITMPNRAARGEVMKPANHRGRVRTHADEGSRNRREGIATSPHAGRLRLRTADGSPRTPGVS